MIALCITNSHRPYHNKIDSLLETAECVLSHANQTDKQAADLRQSKQVRDTGVHVPTGLLQLCLSAFQSALQQPGTDSRRSLAHTYERLYSIRMEIGSIVHFAEHLPCAREERRSVKDTTSLIAAVVLQHFPFFLSVCVISHQTTTLYFFYFFLNKWHF